MTSIATLLELLFSTYPRSDTTDRKSQVAAYALALEGHDPRDVEAAIRKLMRGEVDWHNAEFPPSAPLLGTVVIACRDERLDREARDRTYRQPQLRAPDVEPPTPESRARVKAMVDGFVKGATASLRTEDAARDKRHDDMVARTQKRFDGPQDADSLNRRLGGTAFRVGNDAEDEAQ